MSAHQDLDDLHNALVSYFTGEYEKFLENATGREQDLVRLKDAEKEEALAQLKREHATEMQRKIEDIQLQHRTTEAESVAKMGRQKDKERKEVVKTLEQKYTEQAKQEAVRYAQIERESRDEIIRNCEEEMRNEMEEALKERDRKYADEIVELRQQHDAKQAKAVAQIEREKVQEKGDALAELGIRLAEEAHQVRLRQRSQHHKDTDGLVQRKDKEKREALAELGRKHAEHMEQLRIDMRKSLAEETAEKIADLTEKQDEEKERALAEQHDKHVEKWKRIERNVRDMSKGFMTSKADAIAHVNRKHDKEKVGSAEDESQEHTEVMARALADLRKSYVEREAETVAEVVLKKDEEMKEAMEQLRREHAKATDASNCLAQAKEEDLEASLTETNRKYAVRMEQYRHLKREVKRGYVLLQQKDAHEADAVAKLAQRKNEEKRIALVELKRQTRWKVEALEADNAMYRELEAQTTKRLLDAVHPVLCWVRLHGDDQNNAAENTPEENTVDISKWDPKRVGDSRHIFYHGQHRTRICLPPEEKQWPFDRIFLESDRTEDLWNHVSPMIHSAMYEDRNAMIVTCGKSSTAQTTSHFLLRSTLNLILNDKSRPRLSRSTFDHDTENRQRFEVSVQVFQELDGDIDNIHSWPGECHLTRVDRIETNYYHLGPVPPKTEIIYQTRDESNYGFDRELADVEKYIRNVLRQKNKRANIFICVHIKEIEHQQRRGIVTFVQLAGKDDRSALQAAQSLEKRDQDSPIPESLIQLQGYLRSLAYTETRAAEAVTANRRLADEFDSPLTRLVRWATEIRRPQPLPSIVVIGHVSTVPEKAAESKAMLEWLHGCHWHTYWLKRKADQWPEAARTKLHDDLQRKALQWEDFARRNIEYEICENFAKGFHPSEKTKKRAEGGRERIEERKTREEECEESSADQKP
ncbi:hypothetical protein BKA63DRAFT_573083 [Paraphoma chrysanthemicola]|nr:hypothetical protein BKA63DRAFT_573083 [Paraphoma chrysanthemicola]